MSINKKYIESEFLGIIENLGFFFIDLVIRGDKRQQIFEIFIDNEKGVTTDDCAEVSRAIHEFFDQHEEDFYDYRLDVSSPGVDRPLKYIQQYHKHIGRDFKVSYETDSGKKKQKGKLLNIEGNNLLFKFGKEEIILPFEKIIEAKVQISF
ncbi:MAG: hypothetical protein U5K00_19825 [Melioribacteraceae bacterium]|nr:hypothetical protein [Melioribacteraceae bacterium]